jgi:hypothetical protein
MLVKITLKHYLSYSRYVCETLFVEEVINKTSILKLEFAL